MANKKENSKSSTNQEPSHDVDFISQKHQTEDAHAGSENICWESYRLATFRDAPQSVGFDERHVAAAGFYRNNRTGKVECFSCFGDLRDQSRNGNPYSPRMHRPNCRFANGEDNCGNLRMEECGLSDIESLPEMRPPADDDQHVLRPLHRQAVAMDRDGAGMGGERRLFSGAAKMQMRNARSTSIANDRYAVIPYPLGNNPPQHRQVAIIQDQEQARLVQYLLLLCCELHRYQTFNSNWPLDSAPSGREMAASGWFYLGNLDRTQCFSYGRVLRNWRRLDNLSMFIPPTSCDRNELTVQQISDLRIMFPCEFPVTPNMRSVQDRVNTFDDWNFTRATSQMIAEAGFFSLGVRDEVKCFYCNGGLQNWRQDDDPWEEHAKWYPTCEFLLQQRGPGYLNTIAPHIASINHPNLHRARTESAIEDLPHSPSQPHLVTEVEPFRTQGEDIVEDAIQSEITATIVGLGFDESLVRDVMRAYVEVHGVGYETASTLYDAVKEAERVQEKEEEALMEASRQRHASFSSNDFDSERNNDVICFDCWPPNSRAAQNESQEQFRQFVAPDQTTLQNRDQQTSHLQRTKNRKALAESLQLLKDDRLCKVCLERLADMVIIPCGHICCCVECMGLLRLCLVCRKRVDHAVKVYTS